MADTIRVTFAGLTLDLVAPPAPFLRGDSLWRLNRHYGPFLATCSLPAEGVAVDIGAGFGAFALPFARRYPGWRIWCFEPEPAAFSALGDNIERLGLTNVTALPVAVAGGLPVEAALSAGLLAGEREAVAALCPPRTFRRHRRLDGFLDARDKTEADFEPVDYPTLPPEALRALRPTLLKLMAPHAEEAILSALDGVEPDVLLGESWSTLSPRRLSSRTGAAWLPFARAPRLALRRTPPTADRTPSLVVVIDAGSASDGALAATLAALPHDPGIARHLVLPPSRALPEGTDAMPLSVHHADQPGAAAAFNLGRRRSDSRHIAFLKAGDLPAPGSLAALQTLAELSGTEIVQGGGAEGPDWTDLPREGSFDRAGFSGSFMPASRLLAGFAPSRARLFRRDFLDARGLWFPEHLGDGAEHHLHFLSLLASHDVPLMPGARITSPAPTGLLGDEAFYLPETLRLVVKRVLIEGWFRLAPLFEGFGHAARAAALRLAPALRHDFIESLAEVLVLSEKALGPAMPCPADQVIPEFAGLNARIAELRREREGLADGYAWGWLDAPVLQAPMVAQARLWRGDR